MKRSTLTTILAFVLGISTATQASACLCIPYIPFLDPFAWLGFYGCGGGCGGGYGGGYGGYGYAPAAPSYGYGGGYAPQSYAPQSYAYPVAPQMNPGCPNCTGALPVPQQQAMTAVRVPVTTYRAVTQYVPQTTYRTQYQPAAAPAVAYQPPALGYNQAYGYQPAQTAYAAPIYGGVPSPTTAYNGAIPTQPYGATVYSQPNYATPPMTTPSYGTPYYGAPMMGTPSIASPAGDITGDHEWPTQSAQIPVIPNSHIGAAPVRPATYGVTPRSARTFTATVK